MPNVIDFFKGILGKDSKVNKAEVIMEDIKDVDYDGHAEFSGIFLVHKNSSGLAAAAVRRLDLESYPDLNAQTVVLKRQGLPTVTITIRVG